MVAPLEVLPEPCPWTEVQEPAAFLIGRVRTEVPGYREINADGLFQVASPIDYRLDEIVFGYGSPQFDGARGAVYIDANSTLVFPDRLGWLLGFGVEAGSAVATGLSDLGGLLPGSYFVAPFVSPGFIPLLGQTWTTITEDAERQILIDRHRRNQGYVYGGAQIAQVKLTMHRWALGALLTGWCLRGQVTITAGGLTEHAGYVLGIDGARWLDRIERTAEVLLSIVLEPE